VLQVALKSESQFTAAALLILSEVMKHKPACKTFFNSSETQKDIEEDEEDEHFYDLDKGPV
jgi:hypothetical protein